jgi:hypothetical protein
MKPVVIAILLISSLFVSDSFSQPVVDDFWILVNPDGTCCYNGGGSGFLMGEWFLYESGWVNICFYNAPLNTTRAKIMHIEFDLRLPWYTDDMADGGVVVAVNWATPAWSAYGYGDTRPPLPDSWMNEDVCIVRELLLGEPDDLYSAAADSAHFEFDVSVYDYNPEWVSIDIQGYNFYIFNGVIIHECVDKTVGVENESWGVIKSLYR